MSTEVEDIGVKSKQLDIKKAAVFLIVILGMMIFLPGLTLVLIIGFLPTLGAVVAEPTKIYALSFCVGICNMTGLIPMIHELYISKFRMQAAYALIHNEINLLIILCAAAVGWGIFFTVPVITVAIYKARDRATLAKLTRRYEELKEIWGDAVISSPTIENMK